MEERLLHYLWAHRIGTHALCTTDGKRIELIDPGLTNDDAGPDFFNAKLKLDGLLWVGNVELHVRASDWMRHGHDSDPAYDGVILHVVAIDDKPLLRKDGSPMPTVVLKCPPGVDDGFRRLMETAALPPCREALPRIPRMTVTAWMDALLAERLTRKCNDLQQRLDACDGNWQDALFVTLARSLGGSLNGEAFEAWARALPFRAVDKHRDHLLQVEAVFFGMAGLLQPDAPGGTSQPDGYVEQLRREFQYLTHKFSLSSPMEASRWRLARTRPGNFPHVRLAQLARLYAGSLSLLSRLTEAQDIEAIYQLLEVEVSDYWLTHYTFHHASPRRPKRLGRSALQGILINAVVPFLYFYGRHRQNEVLCYRASALLEQLPAEDNRLIRQWSEAGMSSDCAARSQALLQLSKAYCERRDCLRCRFGYEYLRQRDV